jgi:uncharacterized membrane protein/mono/diheme cytochrome c family protein
MEGISEFIGRFHPLLVHLPIGILILSILFIWLAAGRKNISNDAIRVSLGTGAIFATLSCITGFLLSRSGDYESVTVQWHQWMGIAVAVASIALWRIRTSLLRLTSIVLLVLVVVTGHLGASLTHGSEYLLEPLSGHRAKDLDLASVNYDSAAMYPDVIAHIFDEHCSSCHGPSKQKGRLRLDSPDRIMNGGKNGPVLRAGNPQESEIVERLRLPIGDDHHMPPKERRQPTEKEVSLISLWIESGANFRKPLNEVVSRDNWQALLVSTDGGPISDIPSDDPGMPNQEVVNDLRSNGVAISSVGGGSNYLQVNFVSVPEQINDLLPRMEAIANNVIWLKLGNTNLDDNAMLFLVRYRNLTRLGLERTKVTDVGLANLRNMERLRVLNLNGAQISIEGLRAISPVQSLRSINIYQTLVKPEEYPAVKDLFAQAHIELGGYDVPILATDTTIAK